MKQRRLVGAKVTETNPAEEDHEGGGQISPPEEPFAHMTNHSFFGVNSPVFLTLFGIGLGLFGIWAIGLGVVRFGRTGQGEHLMAVVIGLPFVALGAFASPAPAIDTILAHSAPPRLHALRCDPHGIEDVDPVELEERATGINYVQKSV